MVLVGLGFFVVVFIALFPVLTNPRGAYDRWFPSEEVVIEVATESADVGDQAVGPTARFRWEAVAIDSVDPPLYRIRLTSESLPGDSALAVWRWELGDGSTRTGESVTHDYPAIGSYTIALSVEDENGEVDAVRGAVSVPEVATVYGSSGRIDEVFNLDGGFDSLEDGISDSLEDAVGSVGDEITNTLDGALGSIGTTVRGGVVVALFALAALSATLVAWRIARIGVMLLLRDPDARSLRAIARDRPEDQLASRRELEAA